MVSSTDNREGVSIIIPIYNVEQYVRECLESVMNQTYKKIEIILIDDGSTDRSGEIADNFALKDNRIKVIHKKNGGLSDARNAGIRAATGEYIMFLDSDDYAADDFVESALRAAIDNRADIVCFRFTSVTDSGEAISLSTKKEVDNLTEYANTDAIQDIFTLGGTLKVNAWNKIYKRSLFSSNNIEYPVGRIYEDNQTTYKLMYFAKKIIFLDKSLLFYRQRPGSIMKGGLTGAGIRERYGMINETTSWLDGKISRKDIGTIRSTYMKTLMVVLVHEGVAKKQLLMLPVILLELIKNKVKGL